jgi:hypothetical protein
LAALAATEEQPDQRGLAFERAERLLERSIGTNRFEFYRYALQASVSEGDEPRTLRLCSELEAFTRAEPLLWSDLLVGCARAAFGPPEGRLAQADAALRSDFRWLCLKLLNYSGRSA